MKNEILKLMQEQMHTIANELTFENYREMESQIHRVFVMLESAETMLEGTVLHTVEESKKIEDLPQEEVITEQSEEVVPGEETESEEETENQEEASLGELQKKREQYRFERKIKGGVLSEISAFVPERTVRELDLHEGDKLYADFAHQPVSGPAHYDFEVAERSNGPRSPENIVEIEMGIVKERMDGTYYIDKTVNSDSILYNGSPATFEISEDDVRALRLTEDDIVNAAYYENNPQTLRVRWRYQTTGSDTSTSTPKPSSYYKKKDTEVSKEVEQIFEGKTICAMGFVPGHGAYAEEVEARGGSFLGLSGKETPSTMSSIIGKSDALVMNLKHVSHGGTQRGVSYCKEQNIPYTSIGNFGRTSFVDAAANLLGK